MTEDRDVDEPPEKLKAKHMECGENPATASSLCHFDMMLVPDKVHYKNCLLQPFK